MKMKVVVDFDITQRKVLKSTSAKVKEFGDAPADPIGNHI